MSFFDLHSDAKIPRDGVKKHTVTQIPSEGGATNGLIRFRWTSSQNHWFVPHLSYVLYEFAISKKAQQFFIVLLNRNLAVFCL